jgi:hypothetical protein
VEALHKFRCVIVVVTCLLALACLRGVAAADEPQLLFVRPTSGPAGSTVTVTGKGWSPQYYASGVRISFDQNFGNGVLQAYADDIVVKPSPDGTLSVEATIPASFKPGDIVTFSGLIGNGSGANANYTVTAGGATPRPADLQPTAIKFDKSLALVGKVIHFDSGIRNAGGTDSGVFNVKWLVDGREVGAYGSHAGVPAGATVLNGNSQFDWKFTQSGNHSVTFVVDVDKHIAESNENNNQVLVTAHIADPPGTAQKAEIPHNGCTTPTGSTGQGGTFNFTDACNKHDHCYITHKDESGKTATKDACDVQFYRNMVLWCAKHLSAGNGAADFCYLVARTYYNGVKQFGTAFYDKLAPARIWY